MKKLAMALAMTATMAMASVCAAAGEGSLLSKEQKSAEAFINGLNGVQTVTYAQIAPMMTPEMQKVMTEKKFAEYQKNVKTQAGKLSEIRFFNFRYAQNDNLVTYVAKSEKLGVLVADFLFDSKGKLMKQNLTTAPKPAPQQAQRPAQPAPQKAPARR